MSEAWPWLALLGLGAFHGINPGMGWLFAVALGLQEQRRSAVWNALPPIAVGHALSVGLVVALVAVIHASIQYQALRWRLMEVAGGGLAIAAFLMCVARPSAVMATLLPTALTLRERMLVGWVGLRGAAPIVLATFPLVARVPNAQFIFELIFFVVVTSALIQGTTVSWWRGGCGCLLRPGPAAQSIRWIWWPPVIATLSSFA